METYRGTSLKVTQVPFPLFIGQFRWKCKIYKIDKRNFFFRILLKEIKHLFEPYTEGTKRKPKAVKTWSEECKNESLYATSRDVNINITRTKTALEWEPTTGWGKKYTRTWRYSASSPVTSISFASSSSSSFGVMSMLLRNPSHSLVWDAFSGEQTRTSTSSSSSSSFPFLSVLVIFTVKGCNMKSKAVFSSGRRASLWEEQSSLRNGDPVESDFPVPHRRRLWG